MKIILTFMLISLALTPSSSPRLTETKTWSKFQVDSTTLDITFERLTDEEQQLARDFATADSSIELYQKARKSKDLPNIDKTDFPNNRGRLLLTELTNGKNVSIDTANDQRLPLPCTCYLSNDTLTLETTIGLFNGIVITADLNGDSFTTKQQISISRPSPYEATTTETSQNYRELISKTQALLLLTKPTYKVGQTLTGRLKMLSEPILRQTQLPKPDTINIGVDLFFRCKTRQKQG